MERITEERAIEYFLKKAPKALREKPISKIIELDHHIRGAMFIINDKYLVYTIVKENYGFRRTNYKPQISGIRLTKDDLVGWLEHSEIVSSRTACKVTEWCSFCDTEVEIESIMFEPQKCPNCGHTIKACSLCDYEKCNCAECAKKHQKRRK